jgi:hypothetical protein
MRPFTLISRNRSYGTFCRPGSPDFILDHPDYYAFFTYSAFVGKVAE